MLNLLNTDKMEYVNISSEYRVEVPKSKWETPPKVVDNCRGKILWDFRIQTDKQVLTNQPNVAMVAMEQRKAAVINMAILREGPGSKSMRSARIIKN